MPARVARVGSDAPGGRVRVEFTVQAVAHPRIPLQHGQPGAIDVAIDSLSPATLLLRAIGQLAAPELGGTAGRP